MWLFGYQFVLPSNWTGVPNKVAGECIECNEKALFICWCNVTKLPVLYDQSLRSLPKTRATWVHQNIFTIIVFSISSPHSLLLYHSIESFSMHSRWKPHFFFSRHQTLISSQQIRPISTIISTQIHLSTVIIAIYLRCVPVKWNLKL